MKKSKENNFVYKNIVNVFAWFSFVLAVITAVFTIFSSFSDESNGKQIFGYKFLIVASDSMSKSNISKNEKVFFNAGDIVIIKTDFNIQTLKEGDVITFVSYNPESYGKTLTHKIRSLKTNDDGELIGFETYGINTGESDKVFVVPDTILGFFVGRIAGLGNLFAFLKTPKGYYLSVLTPLLLIIIFFSVKIGKFIAEKQLSIESSVGKISQKTLCVENIAEGIEYSASDIEDIKKRIEILEQYFNELNLTKLDKTILVEDEANGCIDNSCATLDKKLLLFNGKKVSFINKLINLNQIIQDFFSVIHNNFISYKQVKARLSFKCVSYRYKRKLLAKFTIRGKTLKLHLALNVQDFNKNVFYQKDMSLVKAYEQVPFTIKIKSKRGETNAKKLIQVLMQKENVLKDENYISINAIEHLSNINSNNKNQELFQEKLQDKENNFFDKFNKTTKKSFSEKLLGLGQNIQSYFNSIHNEIISFNKVNERVSFKHVSYRYKRNLLAKFTIRGKTLKLHLALNVQDFNKNVFYQKDMSLVKAYEQVPFTIKIKSKRGEANAKKLIQVLMINQGTNQKK